MPRPTQKFNGASIVLVGSFNPTIFQPRWFAANELVPSDKLGNPIGFDIKLIHPDVCDLSTQEFNLQVMRDRFILRTELPSFFDPLKDLAWGTFKLLSHTPMVKMGINREFHYEMENDEKWHALGHRLAPKSDWIPITKNPGLEHLVIRGERDDGRKGFVRITIKPLLGTTQRMVSFEINDHYELEEKPVQLNSAEVMADLLKDVWIDSNKRAEKISEHLLNLE